MHGNDDIDTGSRVVDEKDPKQVTIFLQEAMRSSTDTAAMISTEPAPLQARTVRERREVHEFMVQ